MPSSSLIAFHSIVEILDGEGKPPSVVDNVVVTALPSFGFQPKVGPT